MTNKELVFMEHDGAIDDLLSQILVLTMKDKELIGINVTPADCFIEPAIESTYKILQIFNRTDIEIGRSDYYGINAFPNEWRARPEIVNALPMLINLPASPSVYDCAEAVSLLIRKLENAPQSVSILITGPCSNLVQALQKRPDLKAKIKQVIWMGGAFRTQGNVQMYQHNGTAEWNVFWDPASAKTLFEMSLPLVCIPLDVTNHVPVDKAFLSQLARQSSSPLSHLAGQFWALTIDTIPSYHYVYFMWDILATSYLAIPEHFTIEEVKAKVSGRPPNAGQTMLDTEGYPLQVAVEVNKNVFYEYILEQLKTEITLS